VLLIRFRADLILANFSSFSETSEDMIHYFGGFVQSDVNLFLLLTLEYTLCFYHRIHHYLEPGQCFRVGCLPRSPAS